jgi:glucan phosphoethanolaminetransferase (alkaline phosphatase superfamily)
MVFVEFFEKVPIMEAELLAFFSALLNVIVIFTFYAFLLYCVPGLFFPYALGYVLCIAGIVGISTFYYVHPPMWEVLKSENEERYIEALKLEHD